jgi:hypothetical protein
MNKLACAKKLARGPARRFFSAAKIVLLRWTIFENGRDGAPGEKLGGRS